jgi:hypothetical protein
MTRLLLLAVVVLVAVAAADAVRPKGEERIVAPPKSSAPVTGAVHRSTSGYIAVGPFMRKRVLRSGLEYLSADSVDSAFPSADLGEPFDISHLATAPDGTLALAVYRFPAKDPVQAGIELWREGRLIRAFRVPPGSFGGGLGFAGNGRLVATLLADGQSVLLFARSGTRVGSVSATSW